LIWVYISPRLALYDDDDDSDASDSDDDNVIYDWFPGSATLLREDMIMQPMPCNEFAFMHSVGNGILVAERNEVLLISKTQNSKCCPPLALASIDARQLQQ
jgi:hypothetical protein